MQSHIELKESFCNTIWLGWFQLFPFWATWIQPWSSDNPIDHHLSRDLLWHLNVLSSIFQKVSKFKTFCLKLCAFQVFEQTFEVEMPSARGGLVGYKEQPSKKVNTHFYAICCYSSGQHYCGLVLSHNFQTQISSGKCHFVKHVTIKMSDFFGERFNYYIGIHLARWNESSGKIPLSYYRESNVNKLRRWDTVLQIGEEMIQ